MQKTEFVEIFKQRTKKLAIDVIWLYEKLNKTEVTRIVGKQLIRSATSVAANYRAACVSRSRKEFYSKLSIVIEETDETLFWLELMQETNKVSKELSTPLIMEATEIIKVLMTARKNVYKN